MHTFIPICIPIEYKQTNTVKYTQANPHTPILLIDKPAPGHLLTVLFYNYTLQLYSQYITGFPPSITHYLSINTCILIQLIQVDY